MTSALPKTFECTMLSYKQLPACPYVCLS